MSPAIQPSAEPRADRFQQFLVEVADVINTTLDVDTLLTRVAEVIRRFIDYEIFAILLLNEKTQELRMRFEIGHEASVKGMRVKVGQGITGTAVQTREAVRTDDVSQVANYINARSDVRSELAVPMIVKNRVIGVLDIQSTQFSYFTDEHARMLSLVASRIAAGIENARLYTRVSRQAQTLEVLNEIARELTSILDLDQLFKRTAEALNRLMDYQMFSILLLDPGGKPVLQHRFSLRFKQSIHLKHDIPVGKGLVGAAAESGKGVLVPDVSKDPRYISVNPETKSELCVPLLYKDKVIGVLDLEHTRRGYFTDEHMRTLTTLAAQIAISIENARLYERIAKEEQRLERDLAMAREIQFRLLPACCPSIANAELAAKFVPARELGGDMYDFVRYAGRRTAVAIGDVSGKGAPAALYAALASGILRSHAALELNPAQMLAAMNSSLQNRPVEAQYLSLIYALWDERSSSMLISNSGLPRPIFCHNGETQIIEVRGLPLGLFADASYDEVRISAVAGDVFVFLSDGIIDAANEAADTFGRGRVEEIVAKNSHRTADDIVTAIFDAVNAFSAGTAPFDDQTVVAVKIIP